MERNSTHFDDLIRLAAPAKDVREFERKPDRMVWGIGGVDVLRRIFRTRPQASPVQCDRCYDPVLP